jgi:outer membrane receptor protein involved in Fe transport
MPMTRVTFLPVAAVVCVAGFVASASAQIPAPIAAVTRVAAAHGELQGVVTDDLGEPLAGAVVSALGSTTAFAVTDRAGRFAFRLLPPGPYLVRAHLQGYIPPRARMIQVSNAAPATSSIALARRAGPDQPTQVLAAGLAGVEQPAAAPIDGSGEDHDHSEVAWRLRHLKRSVLKDADVAALGDEDSFWEDSFETIGRAMGHSARVASSIFSDLPLNGEVNFLTTTSFDRPQDLISMHGSPRGVAFVSLNAPTGAGDWNVRGAMTQGDLASWVVAGSYVRRSPAAHNFEAGLLYSMQQYQGGNPVALTAAADGNRSAGEVYAYDRWTARRGLTVEYGARYARYDYLEDDALFSPRVGVTISPTDVLRLRVSASRREIAPGAEEFVPQSVPGVWLPPERTFSPLSMRRGFAAEGVNHYEVAAEHDMGGGVVMGVRAFRQTVTDQMVTLFGVSLPRRTATDVGHYYVASGGDLEARGWGLSVSRELTGRVRGSLDYTRTDAEWLGQGPDWGLLSLVAHSANRAESETIHDLTTSVQTQIPVTATRVYVLYKLNSAFAAPEAIDRGGRLGARFDVQINQALPFLNFTAAQWEMLLTVRNLFREDLIDASMYDELLVVKPPKRIVGGLTVRF